MSRGIWIGSLLLVVAVAMVQQSLVPVNHDAAWHLYAAGAILDGRQLYVDLLEFNPPLIYGLSVVPVWLGRQTGLSEIPLFKIAMIWCAIAMAALLAKLLETVCPDLPVAVRRLLVLIFLYLGLVRVAADFGQREHIFFLVALPYLLLVLGRLRGSEIPLRLLLLVALPAAAGFALKPQFLLLFAALEAYLLVDGRAALPWRRPEVWVVLAGAAGHLMATLLFFPGYFSVAGWASGSYGAIQRSPLKVLKALLGLTLAAPLALLLVRVSPTFRPALKLGWVGFGVLLLLAVVPLKGWTYHFYPLRALSLLMAVAVLLTAREWRLPKRLPIDRGSLARVLLVALTVISMSEALRTFRYPANTWETTPTAQLIEAVESNSSREGLLILDTSIIPAFPVVNYTHSKWTSSFPFLWPLPGLYPDAGENEFSPHPVAERPELEQWFVDTIVEDLEEHRPGLVLVRTVDIVGFEETSFDFIRYFSADPRFAQLWRNYELKGVVDTFRIYTLDAE